VRPTQPVEIFRNISSSFGTLATRHGKFYGGRPRGTNPSGGRVKRKRVVKYSNFGPI